MTAQPSTITKGHLFLRYISFLSSKDNGLGRANARELAFTLANSNFSVSQGTQGLYTKHGNSGTLWIVKLYQGTPNKHNYAYICILHAIPFSEKLYYVKHRKGGNSRNWRYEIKKEIWINLVYTTCRISLRWVVRLLIPGCISSSNASHGPALLDSVVNSCKV